MKTVFWQVILVLICAVKTIVFGAPVLEINCGDVCSAEVGSPHTMSCSWNESLISGIVWTKGTDPVLSCNKAGFCVAADLSYANGSYTSGTSALLRIFSYDPSTDAGIWTCQDSTDPSNSCTFPRPAIGTLQGNCTKDGNTYYLSCTGLTDYGTPPVELQIKDNEKVLANSTTGGSVSFSGGKAGESYSCEVSGEAACLASAPFQCETPPTTPEPTTTTTTSTVTATENNTAKTTATTTEIIQIPSPVPLYAIVIIVVACLAIIIVIIIICVRKCKGKKENNRKERMFDVQDNPHRGQRSEVGMQRL